MVVHRLDHRSMEHPAVHKLAKPGHSHTYTCRARYVSFRCLYGSNGVRLKPGRVYGSYLDTLSRATLATGHP